MTVLGANLVMSLHALAGSEYTTRNREKISADISMYYTSILHKKFYRIFFEGQAGRKNQSGVKSGPYTL
jgi:hypothetical protein